MGVRTIRQFLSQKNIPSGFDRRSLIRIATALVFTIAVLGLIQWAVGTKGWDLTAGLLTIVMVAVGFGLTGVLIIMLPGRTLTAEELAEQEINREPIAKLPWEEPSWYDSSHPGSPFYRDD